MGFATVRARHLPEGAFKGHNPFGTINKYGSGSLADGHVVFRWQVSSFTRQETSLCPKALPFAGPHVLLFIGQRFVFLHAPSIVLNRATPRKNTQKHAAG